MKTMNTLVFSLIIIILVLPLVSLLGLLCYVLWYTLNSNSSIWFAVSWQGKPFIAWELQNTAPDWKNMQKQSDTSPESSSW